MGNMTVRLTPEIQASFLRAIGQLWRDEQKVWEEHDSPLTAHIFIHLRRIENWLGEKSDQGL